VNKTQQYFGQRGFQRNLAETMDICLENMILEARTILEFFRIAGKKQTQGSGGSRNKMSSAHRRMTGCAIPA
jgi:hypothetical protein